MAIIEQTNSTRSDLYLEILQFYARQMRMLDDREFAGYSETFTEDAVFDHGAGGEPARTRAGILQELEAFHRQLEADPQQRRHHFSMVDIEVRDDGTVHTTYYALVLLVRPGETAEVRASCVVRDVLVREEGVLRNRSRHVSIDGRS
jgi:actinorhodin biosynthesis protein ActVIA